MRPAREIVEIFHLLFLRHLSASRDRGLHVLKGGCNLRFFFGSIRYSEDLDLDTAAPSVEALRDRVEGILGSRSLREHLEALRVELGPVTAPKQTETTQRWKVRLLPREAALPLPTKIEFSRRGMEDSGVLEAVDGRLIRRYRLMPLLLSHYALPAAIRQKVGALVNRGVVQARDVFDLSVLFSKAGEDAAPLRLPADIVARAMERVLELDHEDYMGQVIAYLEPDQAEGLAPPQVWESIQLQVIEAVERAGRRTP